MAKWALMKELKIEDGFLLSFMIICEIKFALRAILHLNSKQVIFQPNSS